MNWSLKVNDFILFPKISKTDVIVWNFQVLTLVSWLLLLLQNNILTCIQYLIFSANLVTWLIFWTEMFFKKCNFLPIIPLFIGEECVSDATEFKLLYLSRPGLRNVLQALRRRGGKRGPLPPPPKVFCQYALFF